MKPLLTDTEYQEQDAQAQTLAQKLEAVLLRLTEQNRQQHRAALSIMETLETLSPARRS